MKVEIEIDDLKLLCLNVDYRVWPELRDEIEELSVWFAKQFKFDTHEYRLELLAHNEEKAKMI